MRKLFLVAACFMMAPAYATDNKELSDTAVSMIQTKEGCKVENPYPNPKETVSWTGACTDGMAAGFGVLQWYYDGIPTSGYVGEFQAGKRHGVGQHTQVDGFVMTAVWKDNHPHGFVEWISTRGVWQGNAYVGHYQDGLKHGRGTYYIYSRNFGVHDILRDLIGESWSVKALQYLPNYVIVDVIFEEGELVAVCEVGSTTNCRKKINPH